MATTIQIKLLYKSLKWVYFQRFAKEANKEYPNILIIILQLVIESMTSASASSLSAIQLCICIEPQMSCHGFCLK